MADNYLSAATALTMLKQLPIEGILLETWERQINSGERKVRLEMGRDGRKYLQMEYVPSGENTPQLDD
jgi:hypothetical protein